MPLVPRTHPLPLVVLPAAAVAAALLVAASSPALPRASWPSRVHALELARLDSLAAINYRDSSARLDSLASFASAANDSGHLMVLMVLRSRNLSFLENRLDEAQAVARTWLPFISSCGDTLSWCLALRSIGYADLTRQRFTEASRSYDAMLKLARRARLRTAEGFAWIGTSFLLIQRGRAHEAEEGYRRALRLLSDSHETRALHSARAGLANALLAQGRADEARLEYERVLAESRASRDTYNEAAAINDLGSLEFQYGDPSRAERLFRASAAAQHARGRTELELVSLRNVALCEAALNHNDMAIALFDSVARTAAAARSWDSALRSLTEEGRVEQFLGRSARAESLLRWVVGMRDSGSAECSVFAAAMLAELESASGRGEEARRLMREVLATWRTPPTTAAQAMRLSALGEAEIAAGDPEAALAPLREAIVRTRRAGGIVGGAATANEIRLARAFLALGRRDSATAHYARAAEAWETTRAVPSDPEWREEFDHGAGRMFVQYGELLLDPTRGPSEQARVADAFNALQRFRSRLLEDGLRGAEGRAVVPRVTLERLQRETLRPGELLLDIYSAPETTLVFAVTKTSARAGWATGRQSLNPRLRRLRDLLGAPEADLEALGRPAAELGAELFGSFASEIRGARTLLLSAGDFTQYPLAALRLPGEGGAIADRHRVAFVPSATLLAEGRAEAHGRTFHDKLVVLSRWTDSDGRRLDGIAGESDWLRKQFPNASVRDNDGQRSLEEMLANLGTPEILHLSSHTRNPAAAPWRAGFLLGHGSGEEAYLTADRIATFHMPARVCMLAGCTSMGEAYGPEGLPSLAEAWLEAGARAVICSQWRVEDRTTAELVKGFYAALAAGKNAGEALDAAEIKVRTQPGHSAPRYWAGFVLLGDPETRVELLGGASAPKAR